MDVGVGGGEVCPDPRDASGSECVRRDVLYPGEAGKVGEHVDV